MAVTNFKNKKFMYSCGRKFKVKKVHQEYFKDSNKKYVMGLIDWKNSYIKIATDRDSIDIAKTIIHEIFHNINREQKLNLSERSVEVFANNVYADFVANKLVFK